MGDAKYKRAAEGAWPDVADVRQLICCGQLHAGGKLRRLMLLHPVLENAANVERVTYEGTSLDIVPVPVVRQVTGSSSEVW